MNDLSVGAAKVKISRQALLWKLSANTAEKTVLSMVLKFCQGWESHCI